MCGCVQACLCGGWNLCKASYAIYCSLTCCFSKTWLTCLFTYLLIFHVYTYYDFCVEVGARSLYPLWFGRSNLGLQACEASTFTCWAISLVFHTSFLFKARFFSKNLKLTDLMVLGGQWALGVCLSPVPSTGVTMCVTKCDFFLRL